MKDKSVVGENCMTKKDGNLQTKMVNIIYAIWTHLIRYTDKDTNKFTFGKCAEVHDTTKCTGNILKCANCGGPQQSRSAKCLMQHEEGDCDISIYERT